MKTARNLFSKFDANFVFIFLTLLIVIGFGIYLSLKDYAEPKFKIQTPGTSNPTNISTLPLIKDPEYLNKLIAREWYWVETVYDSSVGIKPFNLSAFKIKFNSDLTFSSTSDCNSIGGRYEIFENKIKFKDIVRTEKYCMKSREPEYVEGLNNVSEISFDNKNGMVLKYKDSGTLMKFK